MFSLSTIIILKSFSAVAILLSEFVHVHLVSCSEFNVISVTAIILWHACPLEEKKNPENYALKEWKHYYSVVNNFHSQKTLLANNREMILHLPVESMVASGHVARSILRSFWPGSDIIGNHCYSCYIRSLCKHWSLALPSPFFHIWGKR